MSTEHGDNELELGPDDILVDGLIKKSVKEGQLEVAIGDGMEFTIHGDLKGKGKKSKTIMNNTKVRFSLISIPYTHTLSIFVHGVSRIVVSEKANSFDANNI